jgi:hypothetical protein
MDLPWDSIIKPIKECIANRKKAKEADKQKENELEKEEPTKDPLHQDPNKRVKQSDIMASEKLMMKRFKQALVQTKQSRVRQFQNNTITDSESPLQTGSQTRLVESATTSSNESSNYHQSQSELHSAIRKDKSFRKEQNLPDVSN